MQCIFNLDKGHVNAKNYKYVGLCDMSRSSSKHATVFVRVLESGEWVRLKNRKGHQAPQEQPTAVSSVVTSLLLLEHEPIPSALLTLKGASFICRGSSPSIRKQMVTFPPLCRVYFLLFQGLLRIDHWNVKMADTTLLHEMAGCSCCFALSVWKGINFRDCAYWQKYVS